MRLLLVVLLAALGGAEWDVPGLLLGAGIGLLASEVLILRRRLSALESEVARSWKTAAEPEEVVFEPAEPSPVSRAMAAEERPEDLVEEEYSEVPVIEPQFSPQAPKAATAAADSADRLSGKLGDQSNQLWRKGLEWLTGGNPVLKVGMVVLFFGVAFLLKYAAQKQLLPLELRLAGAAVGALVLLVVGWRLRLRPGGYGQVLQGGGIGILYLVVFASARLYQLLPMQLSFALLVTLVVLSCMLAVLQDNRWLAIFGTSGGFLAPVLLSTGAGSHVMLFSYYAVLNCAVVAIAWFRSWRELNLLGFLFTFGIGTLWGSSGYRPEHFGTTEPFLVLFFCFYVTVSVLFAHRQPPNLKGFIDGPLVFGLPIVASSLQYLLVRDSAYGLAFSALFLGVFYLLLATLLWRRLAGELRLLCEAFLALGVVFGSLAIPLALDSHWSSSAWALEGAAMVWVGLRQRRLLARNFGLLLQLAAACIFIDSVWYPIGAVPFANRYFLGAISLGLAALFSSCLLDRYQDELRRWERLFAPLMLGWGLIWWYIGGWREVDRQLALQDEINGFVLFTTASSILAGMLSRRLAWPRLDWAMVLQLPVMVFFASFSLLNWSSGHLFRGWGWLVWLLAIFIQFRILFYTEERFHHQLRAVLHCGSSWLVLFIMADEAVWLVARLLGFSKVWGFTVWGGSLLIGLMLILVLQKKDIWPVRTLARLYLGPVAAGLSLVLAGWFCWSLSNAGNPHPLPYLPFVNPMELLGITVLVTIFIWLRRAAALPGMPELLHSPVSKGILAAMAFIWLNSVVARSVHFFGYIPYRPATLFDSVIFQAALATLWGGGALVATVLATRRGSRPLWLIGAGLLALTVLKLFLVDLSGTGTVARIISFLVVGVLMLIIGYFSPIPPKKEADS